MWHEGCRTQLQLPMDTLCVTLPSSIPLLHLAFLALDAFVAEVGRYPYPASDADAQTLIKLAVSINSRAGDSMLDTDDESILKPFAFGASAILTPMAAMFGSIVGQEVVKACSGNFHPLVQFLYFDSLEFLPSEALTAEDVKPLNSRHDAQIAVFGREIQQKIEEAKVFVVGAGALGCEFLKNLALMGVSCGSKGKLRQ